MQNSLNTNFPGQENHVKEGLPDHNNIFQASQISCNSDEKAPAGCLQWYTGEARKTGTVENFNFSGGKHLADQKQHICFR